MKAVCSCPKCKDSKVFAIKIRDYFVQTVKPKDVVILQKYSFKTSMKKGRTKKGESSH